MYYKRPKRSRGDFVRKDSLQERLDYTYNRSMPDNKQLHSFIQTAELGSFSKAAQKAFVSPSALIQQMNLLENKLKVKLFVRSPRELTLTRAGESFYKDAKYMLEYWRQSVERARQAAKAAGPEPVRIGTSLMTPSRFLLDLWPHIQKENPDLKIQLVSFENTPENARGILSRLGENIDVVAGLIDEGFSSAYGCKMLELFQASVCCAVSRHHPLASKKALCRLYEEVYQRGAGAGLQFLRRAA